MSRAIVTRCDVCKENINDVTARYELIQKSIFRTIKQDICLDCIGRIKLAIKEGQADEK